MMNMFKGCVSFNQNLPFASDLCKESLNIYSMFAGCENFDVTFLHPFDSKCPHRIQEALNFYETKVVSEHSGAPARRCVVCTSIRNH